VDSASFDHATLLAEAPFVQRLARALVHDADLAHDVAQDALVAALAQKAPSGIRQLRSWLAGVTRRLASRARLNQRERQERERRAAKPAADDSEERTAARLRLQRRLADAVLSLPEPYRTAVTLRYLDELSPRSIARQRGQSVAAVRQQVHRGLQMLRQRLDAEFGERGSWSAAFAALGLGGPAAWTLVLVPPLIMKKLIAAAVVLVMLGSWWIVPSGASPSSTSEPPSPSAQGVHGAARPSDAVSPPLGTASEPPQRTVLAFRVLIVDAEGQPVAGAAVHCWPEGSGVALRRTSERGLAEFAPRAGAGGILVQAEAWAPVLEEVTQLTGEHRVVLPRGGTVAGCMLVDGAPAPAGVKLRLYGPAPVLPPSLPPGIAELLREWEPQCEASTGVGGRFAFHGLASAWSGSLETPSTHWLLAREGQVVDEDNRRLALARPQPDLLVATTQLPTVSGRVVWDDTGEAVPAPGVSVRAEFEGGIDSPLLGVQGDSAGRFSAGFHPASSGRKASWLDPARREAMTKVQIFVSAAGSDGKSEVELDVPRLRAGGEIVVRLLRAPVTHFRVHDEKGAAVAGARVQSNGISEPTDGEGRGTFVGPRERLLVGAPGFQVVAAKASRPAAGTRDDPLLFVLARANRLVLKLRTPEGGAAVARVELRSRESIFAGARFQSDLDRCLGDTEADGQSGSKAMPDGSSVPTFAVASMQADPRGEIVLGSLAPGVPCVVGAVDSLGCDLVTKEIVTPALGETRELELVVSAKPRRVHGRVLTSDGRPVVSARLRLSAGERPDGRGRMAEVMAGADGAFAFEQVCTETPLLLSVHSRGFVSQQREAPARDRDGEEIVFRLEQGRSVTLRVVDEQGVPVPDLWPDVEAGIGPDPDWQLLGPAEYACSDLPSGTVTFVCNLGGKRFEVRHDTSLAAAELRVPRPARVAIVAPEAWPVPAGGGLAAVATRLDAEQEPLQVALASAGQAPVLLLPGRYRVALVRVHSREAPGRSGTTELGPCVDAELHSGEVTRILLR
jgi:RNA polymerase sigma-70 factor (ECF subfamily)